MFPRQQVVSLFQIVTYRGKFVCKESFFSAKIPRVLAIVLCASHFEKISKKWESRKQERKNPSQKQKAVGQRRQMAKKQPTKRKKAVAHQRQKQQRKDVAALQKLVLQKQNLALND